MASRQNNLERLIKHPVTVLLFGVAGLCGCVFAFTGPIPDIFTFLTGVENMPALSGTATAKSFGPPTTLAVNSPTAATDDTPDLTPTLPPTPSVTNSAATPRLEGDPLEWLPENSNLPPEMVMQTSQTNTNEDVAEHYENPTEIFLQLETWGRLTGRFVSYLNAGGCDSRAGPREIILQVALFRDASGSHNALAWTYSVHEAQASSTLQPGEVGDEAYALLWDFEDNCDPPSKVHGVEFLFRRYNVQAAAYVTFADASVPDSEMEALAYRLAQLIDLKLVANAH